jgi:hypothetical protein
MAATPGKPSLADLLKHFDADAQTRIAHLINSKAISPEHLKEIIRVTTQCPELRSGEGFDSLLEDAEEMDITSFRAWVEDTLKDE